MVGYYSYLYAKSFAATIWQEVCSEDPLSLSTGTAIRSKFLQHGGAKDPVHLLKDFVGSGVVRSYNGGIVPDISSLCKGMDLGWKPRPLSSIGSTNRWEPVSRYMELIRHCWRWSSIRKWSGGVKTRGNNGALSTVHQRKWGQQICSFPCLRASLHGWKSNPFMTDLGERLK